MGTCATLGQAVGAAAYLAVRDKTSPRGVYWNSIEELQDILMEDDCYLPFHARKVPELTLSAELKCSSENAENLRNGLDRPIDDSDNGVMLAPGQSAAYLFGAKRPVGKARIVWDSDLNRDTMPHIGGRPFRHNMLANRPWHCPEFHVPKTMTRAYRIEGLNDSGNWTILYETHNNYQRLNVVPIKGEYLGIRLTPLETWGNDASHVFSFDVR
jgi:hypothetical protein